MVKSRNILPPRRYWLAWEVEFLRRTYADSLTADLARVLGMPQRSVLAKANALGLHKSVEVIAEVARERSRRPDHGGRAHQFRTGHTTWNKGTHFDPGGRSAETRFKPGSKPHTWVPVGSYRVTADGALELKTGDDPGPYTVRWTPVARLVWEAAHGPIPAGHSVVFKPGMRTTDPELLTVDRMECLTRQQLMARNTVHQYGPLVASIAQLRGAINRQINKRTKDQA
jgi:hypothetical protein